jgi:hypothetical protein
MKNEPLQQSELLAKHFAPYREEAPLVSAPEIEKLLAGSDTADHPPTPSLKRSGRLFNTRRIFMTLSGLAGISAIAYFAFFGNPQANNGTNGTTATNRSQMTHPSHTIPDTTELSQFATPANTSAKHTQLLRKTDNPHGPWSAGNDQFYADLSREELAKLGIVVVGDSVLTYKLNNKDSVVWTQFSAYSIPGIKYKGASIRGGGISASAPQGVVAHRFYPILMTYSNGNGAAYRIENGKTTENGIIGPNDAMQDLRAWLQKPGSQGYYSMGYEHNYSFWDDKTNEKRDSVKIHIGKNLPQPSFMPAMYPPIEGYSDTVANALKELAQYCEGSSSVKPTIDWPKTLSVKVDTFTAQNMLDEMDSEENNSTMQQLRSIMARLNELVPIIVRPHGGSGAPDSNDYIFWYEPSDELFDALPPSQASIIRAKLNAPPHCLSMPNEVLKIAEITYCVAEPQEVQVTVQDLTGKWLIIMDQLASAGDNILQFPTETLPTGMYIVTVRDHDSTTRSQRLWVENAHPIATKGFNWKSDSPHAPDQLIFINNDDDRTALDSSLTENHPGWLNIPSLELNAESLAKLGIESDTQLVAYYRHGDKPNVVIYWGIMRNGYGMRFNTLDRDSVTSVNVPSFEPTIITDGRGRCSVLPPGDSAEKLKTLTDIDKLLPILVRENATKDSITKRDLIFWYKPTSEFLALLPDSARAVAEMMASGTTNAPASVTDIHGAIQQAIAFPNPSKGSFSVQLTLGGARTLTFTLRNLLGQQAAPAVQARMDGTGEQSLDFSTAPEGVYLLDISSDQGERYIERVVIAH